MANESNHASAAMMLRSILVCSAALFVIAACQTTASAYDVPATITNPDDASRTALQQAVNDALKTDVLLAADALTESSILIIARNPPNSAQGRLATGRNMDTPIQFRLVVNDADCILIDTRDETRYRLENTTCAAE